MLFLISLGLAIFSVVVLGGSIKSFGNDFKVSFGGQTKTNALSDGSGSKAQALKDKPRAFNPLGAIAGAVGIGAGAAGVAAGAATKILPGAAGLAFKGAKLGVNAAKIAGGGLAAGAEALNKATGLSRKISGFVKPIGQKVRFKANSVTGFLKDQLETEGDRLRNRFRENKQIISNNLPEGFKRGITGINNGIKAGAKFTRDKAKASLEEMKANRAEWNEQKREMARNFKRRRAMIASALQDTSGYKLFKEGLEGIIGPKKLPKKSVFHAKYGKNSLSYQESEDSNKLMNYTQMKNLLESNYAKAALSKVEIDTLTNQMNADYKTHGNDMRYSLSPEYKERIRKTKEMLNSSYGKKYQEAFMAADQENDKVAIDTVGKFLGKANKNQFHGLLENHIKDLLGPNASRTAIQEKRQEILNEIANDTDGVRARMFLSESDREKLKKEIAENQDNNTRSHVLAISAELTREYKKENPSISDNDANTKVINASAEIIESLTRLQQSTPRTEVVTNTTQVVQTAGSTANNTVVNNTTVNNTANNTTGTTATSTSSSSTSSTSSNNSGGNARTIERVVVEKGPSTVNINTNELRSAIEGSLASTLRGDINKTLTGISNAFDSKFEGLIDKLNDKQLTSFRDELNKMSTEQMQTAKSIEDVIDKFSDDFYLNFATTVDAGKRKAKQLFRDDGKFDRMSEKIANKFDGSKDEPITNVTQNNKRGRKRKPAIPDDDTYDGAE